MEIQRIRLIRFTWPGENSIYKNNDADGKLQKFGGQCLILSSDHYVFSLRTSTKVRQTQFVGKTQLVFQVIDQQHRTKMFYASVTDYDYLDGHQGAQNLYNCQSDYGNVH